MRPLSPSSHELVLMLWSLVQYQYPNFHVLTISVCTFLLPALPPVLDDSLIPALLIGTATRNPLASLLPVAVVLISRARPALLSLPAFGARERTVRR